MPQSRPLHEHTLSGDLTRKPQLRLDASDFFVQTRGCGACPHHETWAQQQRFLGGLLKIS